MTDRNRIGRVELNLRDVDQLFEQLDPSPFRERDLGQSAEEWIVASVKEMSAREAYELVLHLYAAPVQPAAEQVVGDAMRCCFVNRC